jgi:hypothetical protein
MAVLLEILLVLLPFAIYAAWWRFGREPSRLLLLGMALLILAGLALAGWYATSGDLRPGVAYVPPRLEGDRVLPGHAAPRP